MKHARKSSSASPSTRALRDLPERELGSVPVERVEGQGPLIEERYACNAAGMFEVTLTALEDGYQRWYALARHSA